MKQADDDPDLPKRRNSVALAKFLSLHPVNVSQRTEVIVEHVRHHMDGRAKAMVVTSSRLSAVRYVQAFQRYIAEHGYKGQVRPLVAFSGTVTDPDTGEEFTEPGMNIGVVTSRSISEAALLARFASPDYQILLVAEKYQTGFDQPLLQREAAPVRPRSRPRLGPAPYASGAGQAASPRGSLHSSGSLSPRRQHRHPNRRGVCIHPRVCGSCRHDRLLSHAAL